MPPHIDDLSSVTAETKTSSDLQDLKVLGDLINNLQPTSIPDVLPSDVKGSMHNLIAYLLNVTTSSSTLLESSNEDLSSEIIQSNEPSPMIQRNITLNRKTTLEVLYAYRNPNPLIEYPETSVSNSIGYLVPIDPDHYLNPVRNIVYSLGEPKGSAKIRNGKEITCNLLVGKNGRRVPCVNRYFTCQGMKICPFADIRSAQIPHTSASRQDLASRLEVLNQTKFNQSASPSTVLFSKTFEYYCALKRNGCGCPLHEETIFSKFELELHLKQEQLRNLERRGNMAKENCKGRLMFGYTRDHRAFVQCEHYNSNANTDHFIDFSAGNGLIDLEYLEALFTEDRVLIDELEYDASLKGYGPLSVCSVVTNFSSNKLTCPHSHRNSKGELINPQMEVIKCRSTVQVYEPLEEYRKECPWALIICHGAHTHPIPIPSKPPPLIQQKIMNVIETIGESLPDLTSRRLLRHPILKKFLHQELPHIFNPMLMDLHPSLANREMLQGYIIKAQEKHCPEGTGWKGLLYLKKKQDNESTEKYIRFMGEFPELGQADEIDRLSKDERSAPLRIVICMLKENSLRLLKAQFLQSDIGFKRVVGWKEFELAGLDPITRLSITYCRVFVTRQTADAHALIFQKIDEIVKEDTGFNLQWRHLHSTTSQADGAVGICQIAVDQHGGQAKGLGQYLCKVSSQLPQKPDVHEPHFHIQDLNEYDHLKRILRLCKNHFLRNIQSSRVNESVRKKMRSLLCVHHSNLNVTLREIAEEGGKAGQDWVDDKIRAKFVIPAICWEMSYIPLEIWQVGDDTSNIVEESHEDINREGITCTLVGGVEKGYHFDTLKSRTIEIINLTGIRPSYQRGHLSESISRSVARKTKMRSKILQRQDSAIEAQNTKLSSAFAKALSSQQNLAATLEESSNQATVNHRMRQASNAHKTYEKEVEKSRSNIGTGSGKVGILLPEFPIVD